VSREADILAQLGIGVAKPRRKAARKKPRPKPKPKPMKDVGKPKARISFPKNAAYLTVAYGGGVDSTAMLIGLDQLWRETRQAKWIPRVVSFSDTGGEHPETYAYISGVMDRWLAKAFKGGPHHPGRVVKIATATIQGSGGWGTNYTLEQKCLNNHSLPGISLGKHQCSSIWKIGAQASWFKVALASGDIPKPKAGKKIVRAIGYDATEQKRLSGHSTYVLKDEERKGNVTWTPLMEWGWDRARCIAEIQAELGCVPRKSSCWFCGAMKPEEIVMLAEDHPDLLERAILMEQVWYIGRNKNEAYAGIGSDFSWTDFVLGNLDKLTPRAQLGLLGGVAKIDKRGHVHAIPETFGKPEPRNMEPNHLYISRGGLKAVRRAITPARVRQIKKMAKTWVNASPDKGKRVMAWRTLRKDQKARGRKTRQKHRVVKGKKEPYLEVYGMGPDSTKSGQRDKDMALDPLTYQLAAFTNVLGFRVTGELAYDDIVASLAKKTRSWETSGNKNALIDRDKIRAILERNRRSAVNPPDVNSPSWQGGYDRSPMLGGGGRSCKV
jgi:hypothetical protein